MSASNTVFIIGNLIADAELKFTAGGMAVASFAVANNYRKRQGDNWVDDVSFFDVGLFGKRAESVHPYLKKGQPVAVTGELRQDRWEKDGQKFSRIKILGSDLKLLNKREGGQPGEAHAQSNPAPASAQARPAAAQQARPAPAPDPMAFDDDIPFDFGPHVL